MLIKIVLIILTLYFFYVIFPTYIYKIKNYFKRKKFDKRVYLTFDDGPSDFTPLLLDVLKKYNVKASFFCVTKSALKYKNVIKRIKKENHIIGIHSSSHQSAYLMGPIKTNNDFNLSIKNMSNLTEKVMFYRPPWGILNIFSLINIKKYNLKLVLWDIMVGDWKKNITKEKISTKLLKIIGDGAIICLHDGRGKNNAHLKTIEALDEVIPILLKKGYKFETVDKYEK